MRTQLAERLLQLSEAIDNLTRRGYSYIDTARTFDRFDMKIQSMKWLGHASDCKRGVTRLKNNYDNLIKSYINKDMTLPERVAFDKFYTRGNSTKFNEVFGELIIDNLNEDSVSPEIYSALIKTIAYFENKEN